MNTQQEQRKIFVVLALPTTTLEEITRISRITNQNLSQVVEVAIKHFIQLEDDMNNMGKYFHG